MINRKNLLFHHFIPRQRKFAHLFEDWYIRCSKPRLELCNYCLTVDRNCTYTNSLLTQRKKLRLKIKFSKSLLKLNSNTKNKNEKNIQHLLEQIQVIKMGRALPYSNFHQNWLRFTIFAYLSLNWFDESNWQIELRVRKPINY